MNTKKTAVMGLCIALAMIMSYIETLFPLNFAVPGIKMGLANIVIIFILYKVGLKEAFIVSIIRVILVSLLFGNVMSMAYGLSGAFLSLLLMSILKKADTFSVVGVSVVGAISHNAGQIIIAIIVMGAKEIAYYLPALCISGTVTGILIGIVSSIVVNRIKKIQR